MKMISESIEDFILSLRDPDLFLEKALLSADKVQGAVGSSLRQILVLLKWSLIFFGASLLLAILLIVCLGTGWSPSWYNLILLILCGFSALGGLVLMAPLVMLAQPVIEAIPGFKEWLKKYPGTIASASFLMLFAVFTYWKLQMAFSPGAAASIFFVMLVIGAGSATGWVLLPRASVKAIITSQLFFCFFFLMASAVLPKLLPASGRFVRHKESLAAEGMDDSISQLIKIDPDDPQMVWFNADGSPRYCFTQDRNGVFRVFHADVGTDPGTGQETSLVTTVEKRDEIIEQVRNALNLQKRQRAVQAEERDRHVQAEAVRIFRGSVLKDGVLASANGPGPFVMLACRSDPPSPQADATQANVAGLVAKKGIRVVAGLFKPAFYTGGAFDDLWNGDQSIVDRLGLLEKPSSSLLLASVKLSGPGKTELEGLVSVQGTLSIIVVDKQARRGPYVFSAAGAGADPATASAACARRLVEAIDLDMVFP